jgi:hypothetical protein
MAFAATWSRDSSYDTASGFTVSLATLDGLLTPKRPMLEMNRDGGSRRKGQAFMLDLVFVVVTVMFFALSVGYVSLCDRLQPEK